jgi:hypothetical protein
MACDWVVEVPKAVRRPENQDTDQVGSGSQKNQANRRKTGKATVKHGYPWVPTDQAHVRPRQVGPAYQKTCRSVSGPNQPGWHPTRPPKDLPEDSPDDLIHHDLKIWCKRQELGGFRPKQIDGIWQDV